MYRHTEKLLKLFFAHFHSVSFRSQFKKPYSIACKYNSFVRFLNSTRMKQRRSEKISDSKCCKRWSKNEYYAFGVATGLKSNSTVVFPAASRPLTPPQCDRSKSSFFPPSTTYSPRYQDKLRKKLGNPSPLPVKKYETKNKLDSLKKGKI